MENIENILEALKGAKKGLVVSIKVEPKEGAEEEMAEAAEMEEEKPMGQNMEEKEEMAMEKKPEASNLMESAEEEMSNAAMGDGDPAKIVAQFEKVPPRSLGERVSFERAKEKLAAAQK